jgi:protein-disulfide isomerase
MKARELKTMPKRRDKRAAARVVREQLERERRRKRNLWTAAIAVGALAIAAVVGWFIYSGGKTAVVHTPAHANAAGNGIVSGSGPVPVEDYVDFLCPHCKVFHDEATATLNRLVQENKITFTQHPVAYLDSYSTNQYSTRASAASGCAADQGKFEEFAALLFANQPPEGSAGPTDDELISMGTTIGLTGAFAQCVRDKRYVTWAKKVSDDAAEAGVTGTPTVLVNGQKVQASAAAIVAAVNVAGGATPTPTR